ncbi:efflux RND transporter periplasmic adaptor subunit [Tamlana fucoidanivorans]|uniref:Efflux RND transporter periplasmic adaptor subunit n=1 Tax=Allotamlana fucoidanivorans TaxID=2583814 RepID=A0A5C4SLM3_9FLAO|nr:efflux RND transporter periplasmic adaptor subunit [Tamlana fucoidanivorans]TNJ44172.1 efflux RND transporter periplasmic adaptor subunit [Tamlana fucoidanivorans]
MKHLYILFCLLSILSCGTSEQKKEIVIEEPNSSNAIAVTSSQFSGQDMALGQIEPHQFNQTIHTTGTIDVPPKNKALISTFIGGYITNTILLEGDNVKKGQLLVSLENPEYVELQERYLEVHETLKYLKAEFERQKKLFDENISSQKVFLKAESDYKSNLARYNSLEKKLNMLNINPSQVKQGNITSTIHLYSPIDGYVSRVNINHGMYVSPSHVILEIVDTDHIHLELSVFEKDILNVKKGQNIVFTIPEASFETFEAEVHLVGNTIDETSRVVKVHAHIKDESSSRFIVGMFVEAKIITDTSTKMALPKTAIIDSDNSHFALVLKNENNNTYHFEKRNIEIGLQTENHAEILNTKDFTNKSVLTKGGFMLINEGSQGGHQH